MRHLQQQLLRQRGGGGEGYGGGRSYGGGGGGVGGGDGVSQDMVRDVIRSVASELVRGMLTLTLTRTRTRTLTLTLILTLTLTRWAACRARWRAPPQRA